MSKKQSKTELFEAGICPDCGGKLHFEGIKKTEDLIKLGYVKTEAGFYEKSPACHVHKNPDPIPEDETKAKENHRGKMKWRYRNLKLAEDKRARRNLKRSLALKRGGF